MRDSDFKRVKHHHMPGDIGKGEKKKYRSKPSMNKRAKSFNDTVRARTRSTLKDRTIKEIQRQLED